MEYPPPPLRERGLDLLFPPVCVGCRRVGRWICPRCWQGIQWTHDRRCEFCMQRSLPGCCTVCGDQNSPIERILAVVKFEGLGRMAVHTLKYHERYAISGMMGRLMAIAAAEEAEVSLVTHVPLHVSRRRERGFDQSAKLAKSVAEALSVSYQGDCLKRSRKTRQQALLNREERIHNVAGAFLARRPVRNETVLLVDDVLTTGATLQAAAGALRGAGARVVIGLVFAYAEAPGSL